jgi:hypothetical protein
MNNDLQSLWRQVISEQDSILPVARLTGIESYSTEFCIHMTKIRIREKEIADKFVFYVL